MEKQGPSHTIGVLSDTHLNEPNERFRRQVSLAFEHCDAVIHAGDLVDISVLQAFGSRKVYAVHGNMCNHRTRSHLPEHLIVSISGCRIAICHGWGYQNNSAERLYERFPEADCIIYGHTHRPANQMFGATRLLNPGSFLGTGTYGNPGNFALMTITGTTHTARLETVASTL